MEDFARQFAATAHAGVYRKYSGEPYITHPEAVAELVRMVPHTPAMIIAALLHDVVEDTDVTLVEIECIFGWEVAQLVGMVTNVSKPSDGNRATRKEIDRRHTALILPKAKTIRLGDIITNVRDIVGQDPDFAKIYIPEKALVLKVLTEGDPLLWTLADQTIKHALKRISQHQSTQQGVNHGRSHN